MKKSIFASLFLFVVTSLFCASAFAQNCEPEPYILFGPHINLDEPWKVSQFNEALVGEAVGFGESAVASDLITKQGKTIKNSAGKIYYLEVQPSEYSIDQRAFIGNRRVLDDKQVVSFYTVQGKEYFDITLRAAGSFLSCDSKHSLGELYSATYQGRKLQIIEFNQIDWSERSCADASKKNEKKCMASRVYMTQRKLAFAIDEDGSVLASSVVSKAEKKCSDSESCEKALVNKIKSIKDVKSFALTKSIVCDVNKPASKKEAVTLSCHKK